MSFLVCTFHICTDNAAGFDSAKAWLREVFHRVSQTQYSNIEQIDFEAYNYLTIHVLLLAKVI